MKWYSQRPKWYFSRTEMIFFKGRNDIIQKLKWYFSKTEMIFFKSWNDIFQGLKWYFSWINKFSGTEMIFIGILSDICKNWNLIGTILEIFISIMRNSNSLVIDEEFKFHQREYWKSSRNLNSSHLPPPLPPREHHLNALESVFF